MTPTITKTLLVLLCSAACASDDDDDDDGHADDSSGAIASSDGGSSEAGSSTTEDPFADCDRGTLEPDLMGQDAEGNPVPSRWMGQGADPQTGELVDDGRTYVVSSTYLALSPAPSAQQAFGEAMGPIIPELLGNPGMIATQLAISVQCSTARTFTVWESQEAMMAFVTSDAHAAAIANVATISRGHSLVTHWSGATIPEITWDAAIAKVVADEGPFY